MTAPGAVVVARVVTATGAVAVARAAILVVIWVVTCAADVLTKTEFGQALLLWPPRNPKLPRQWPMRSGIPNSSCL